jgi:multidrug transporter EmrE-like cation transporter
MKVGDFLLILVGVLLNAAAQLLLKVGASAVGPIGGMNGLRNAAIPLAMQPSIWGGLACYAISVVVWVVALSRVDVSLAYPILSIGYVVNAFVAMFFLNETVSPMRWAGIAVILLGVGLVAQSSRG